MAPPRKHFLQPQQTRAGALYTPGAPLLPDVDSDIESRCQEASRGTASASPPIITSDSQTQQSHSKQGRPSCPSGPEAHGDTQWKGGNRCLREVDLDSAHASNCLDDVLARNPSRALQGFDTANNPLCNSPDQSASKLARSIRPSPLSAEKDEEANPELQGEPCDSGEAGDRATALRGTPTERLSPSNGEARGGAAALTGPPAERPTLSSGEVGEEATAFRPTWMERPTQPAGEVIAERDDSCVSDETHLLNGSTR